MVQPEIDFPFACHFGLFARSRDFPPHHAAALFSRVDRPFPLTIAGLANPVFKAAVFHLSLSAKSALPTLPATIAGCRHRPPSLEKPAGSCERARNRQFFVQARVCVAV